MNIFGYLLCFDSHCIFSCLFGEIAKLKSEENVHFYSNFLGIKKKMFFLITFYFFNFSFDVLVLLVLRKCIANFLIIFSEIQYIKVSSFIYYVKQLHMHVYIFILYLLHNHVYIYFLCYMIEKNISTGIAYADFCLSKVLH